MDSWKCGPCDKSFTGLVCFQQHEASEKHKKKVRLMNSYSFEMPNSVNPSDSPQQVYCDMCHISISGWENYQKHSNSLEHAIMVQKKNNDLLSLSVSSTFELKTERNQPMGSTISVTRSTKPIIPFAECKPCSKEFSGPEPYQQHLASAGHKKKCGPLTQIMQIDETDSIIKKEKIDDNLPNDPQTSESTYNLCETVPQIFAKCDVCEMQFSGALPYQIHLVSDDHKMKAGNQLLESSFAENQNAYKCDICLMTFTGPVPYQQHIVSKSHKKKMSIADPSLQLADPPDSTLKNSHIASEQSCIIDQRWYCDICKKPCSGPIPFKTHIEGKEHSKNLRKLMVEENLKKIKVLGPLPYVGNNEIDSDASNNVTSTSYLDAGKSETAMEESSDKINNLNINVKNDDTKILSDKYEMDLKDLIALPNLNIIPPEKLDVTVFQPDDEIVFSSPKKYRQQLPSEMKEV